MICTRSQPAAHEQRLRLRLRPLPSPSRAALRPANRLGGFRRLGRLLPTVLVPLILLVLGASMASAEHPAGRISAPDAGLAAPLRTRLETPGRARGMAFLDLPLGLRARYEARALHRFGGLHDGSSPLAEFMDDADRRTARLLESRFALSRALAPHVELELAWAVRSPLSMFDLTRIEDQRVAAMFRIAP